MAGIDLPAVVEMLAQHTFACSDPVPDPVVALVTYSCTTVTEDLDTTGTAIVIIEASPDGQRVFQLEGRLAIRTGPPDDDLAVGLCGSVLGALPFAEPAPPDFARWVASNLEAGADRRFGSLQVDLYGPPADRRCRFSAA